MSPVMITTRRLGALLATAAIGLGAGHTISAQRPAHGFVWFAELVSVDRAAKTVTVKARGGCGSVKGEQKSADIEKTKTSKEDLLAALRDSFAYCDSVYDGLTDRAAVQKIKVGESKRTKSGMLWANTIHIVSHYGNLVTYLRIKGFVPPSTEGQ